MTGTEIFWKLGTGTGTEEMWVQIVVRRRVRVRIVFEKSGTGTECPTEYVRVFLFFPW